MDNDKIDQLKKDYMNVPIPKELEFVVKKTLQESGVNMTNKNNTAKRLSIVVASTVAAVAILTVGVNSSPAFAKTMSDIPVIGNLVKVLTFNEYKVNEDGFQAEIKVPAIQGLENKALETSINERYIAENKKLYDQFMIELNEAKKAGKKPNSGVNSGYEVMTDNDTLLSVQRWVVKTKASSDTQLQFDTIDKKKQVLLTLPSLFKDDRYVDAISANILSQMRKNIKEGEKKGESKAYRIDIALGEPDKADEFTKISPNQNFYINKDSKLVISFDKYEVAPGSMGAQEFVIPTEVISNILIGGEYIK